MKERPCEETQQESIFECSAHNPFCLSLRQVTRITHSRDVLSGTFPFLRFLVQMLCLLSAKWYRHGKSVLALRRVFTPLRCYWFVYLWPESLLMWSMYIKWKPCLCSQALSGSVTNVQTIAGTFSTVCSSSTHTFHLLWKMKFQCLGAGSLSLLFI